MKTRRLVLHPLHKDSPLDARIFGYCRSSTNHFTPHAAPTVPSLFPTPFASWILLRVHLKLVKQPPILSHLNCINYTTRLVLQVWLRRFSLPLIVDNQ